MRRPRSAGVERAPRELGGAWKNLYSITVAVRPRARIERLIASMPTRSIIRLAAVLSLTTIINVARSRTGRATGGDKSFITSDPGVIIQAMQGRKYWIPDHS